MITAQRALLLCTLALFAIGVVNGQIINCLVPGACNGPLVVLFKGSDRCDPSSAQMIAWPILPDATPKSRGVCQNSPSLVADRTMFAKAASQLGFSESIMDAMIRSLPKSLAGPQQSSMWDCSANNQTITIKGWTHGGCTGSPDAIDIANPGVCLNGTLQNGGKKVSWMSTCSLTAKILPPLVPVKTPLTSVPTIDRQSARMCDPGTKCGLAWHTVYTDPNCQKGLVSLSWPQTTTTGQALQSNKCYGDIDPMGINIGTNAYNIQYTCTKNTFTITSYAAGCTGLPLNTLQINTNICLSNGSGTSIKVFCSG
jgi:hypothetical protein